MRLRLLFGCAVLLGSLVALAAPVRHAGAADPPRCFDYFTGLTHDATKWLTSPGTLIGTKGDDVLVGTIGSDVIKGLGGNNIIRGSPDYQFDVGTPDVADGGSGQDHMIARGKVTGGAGDDSVLTDYPGSTAEGGSGSDVIWAAQGAIGDGGSGSDILRSIFGGAAALLGGSSSDTVFNETGAQLIDRGSAYDYVLANGATDIRRCEGTLSPP